MNFVIRQRKPEKTAEDAAWNLAVFNHALGWAGISAAITCFAWILGFILLGKP